MSENYIACSRTVSFLENLLLPHVGNPFSVRSIQLQLKDGNYLWFASWLLERRDQTISTGMKRFRL